MSQIRKAHSVEIIDRRLRQYESADAVDPMELIELHDELARVARKWLEKFQRQQNGQPGTRPLSNAGEMNQRFERLARLIDVSLRKPGCDDAAQPLLQTIRKTLQARQPLPSG